MPVPAAGPAATPAALIAAGNAGDLSAVLRAMAGLRLPGDAPDPAREAALMESWPVLDHPAGTAADVIAFTGVLPEQPTRRASFRLAALQMAPGKSSARMWRRAQPDQSGTLQPCSATSRP